MPVEEGDIGLMGAEALSSLPDPDATVADMAEAASVQGTSSEQAHMLQVKLVFSEVILGVVFSTSYTTVVR